MKTISDLFIILSLVLWGGWGSRQLFRCSFSGIKRGKKGFPGGTVVKNAPANAGDTGSSLGLGRSHMPRSN